MKLSETAVCVNMVNCQVCKGKGHFWTRGYLNIGKKVKVVCDRCKGIKRYQEECGELIVTGVKRCPSCTGTSHLLLSRVIENLHKKLNEKAGHPGKAIEDV